MAVVSLSYLKPKSFGLRSFTFLGLDQTLTVEALMASEGLDECRGFLLHNPAPFGAAPRPASPRFQCVGPLI